jgi:hypothetical protein
MYAEHFPALIAAAKPEVLAWFSHRQALAVLDTFAGAWLTLGRNPELDPPDARWLFVATPSAVVCRFRGRELAAAAIVVDDFDADMSS